MCTIKKKNHSRKFLFLLFLLSLIASFSLSIKAMSTDYKAYTQQIGNGPFDSDIVFCVRQTISKKK